MDPLPAKELKFTVSPVESFSRGWCKLKQMKSPIWWPSTSMTFRISPRWTTNAAPSVAGITKCFLAAMVPSSFRVLLVGFPRSRARCSSPHGFEGFRSRSGERGAGEDFGLRQRGDVPLAKLGKHVLDEAAQIPLGLGVRHPAVDERTKDPVDVDRVLDVRDLLEHLFGCAPRHEVREVGRRLVHAVVRDVAVDATVEFVALL